MIIILEGPDLSGKSTFARKLASLHDGETISLSHGQPEDKKYSPFLEYERDFLEKLPDDPAVLVTVDRLAAGEVVYGPLLRRHSRYRPGGLLHTEMLCAGLGASRFMMMPPLDVLISRFRMRGDALIDPSELAHIREQYVKLAPRYTWTQFRDVPDDKSCELILERALHQARRAKRIQAVAPGYIGTLVPEFVLVGDIRAGRPEADPYIAAFTPDAKQGAAQFLMAALDHTPRLVTGSFGIMNANEPGADLKAAAKALGHPWFICMGGNAARAFDNAVIPHVTIPHPSWVTRFSRDTTQGYAETILKAAKDAKETEQ